MSSKDNNSPPQLDLIRNIGIIAHIDAGKTTVTERILYYSGKTHKLGEVDSGNTVMDYLEEERERGITIVAAAASFEWKKSAAPNLIHLIDTPGHIDFTAEVERSLRVIDGAVVIFSGVEGVEAQSEKVWRQSAKYNVPKIAFINKLDRSGASFRRVLEEIRSKFSSVKVSAFQIPVGSEMDLKGVIDLIQMKSISFQGEDGSNVVYGIIPDEYVSEAESAREEMLSCIADLSDAVAEFYLSEEEVPQDILKAEIRKLVISNKIVPVLTGSAKRNIGIQPILDAICDYFPSPNDRDLHPGISPKTGEHVEIRDTDPAFCGLVFKLIASGSADLLYMRTYSGRLKVNDTLVNTRTNEKVRIKRILRLYAKNVEAVEEIGPGDIIGLIGPSNTFTGDTLCAVNRIVLLEKIVFPDPVISIAVEPKSTKDKDRLNATLEMLCREDPTLSVKKNEATGQNLISGMGELHLEITCNRIRNDYHLEARFGVPQVAFRETLKAETEVTGIFNRTIGEKEYYAEVKIRLTPVPRLEKGIEVINSVKNRNSLPNAWINSAVETLNNGLRTGGNWGYSLIYIRGELLEITGLPDKTIESSVAGAVLEALQLAIRQTGTILLEPIVKVDILSPEAVIGEITGYLQARRAVIHKIDSLPDSKHLSSEVPLSEMFGFSKALPKLSGGRAAFSMEPCGYQEISSQDLDRMVNRNTEFQK
ncbi:MAG TPA: elongation factor G [Lentisphaeria bacterium]|nr:MAG: translation elongation factor G [Lentisphaerae bacterium GWF2_49_21]HBC86506.1 elongation factor G [Lentisphaeria bacterium]